jgi:hypothetical protein
MTASTRLFNGSTFSFGSAVARVVGVQYKIGGATVDVSEPEDLNKLFEAGQADLELSIKVKRMPTLTRGAKAVPTMTWANGDTTAFPGTWGIMSTDGGGDWDAGIAGNITIKPTVPDAS